MIEILPADTLKLRYVISQKANLKKEDKLTLDFIIDSWKSESYLKSKRYWIDRLNELYNSLRGLPRVKK